MSELDLGLKIGTRRLLWAQGFSTRLDVVLRSDTSSPSNRSIESFTDLDVLGIAISPGYRLTRTIADCKTGKSDKPVARMFWARGVAELFHADQVLLVRDREVPMAARLLSNRLDITVVTPPDLQVLQQAHGLNPASVDSSPLSILFDHDSVAKQLGAFTSMTRKLNPLLEYRNFDYWLYDDHENPFQLVAHLRDSRNSMDPKDPSHLALFMDLAWLFTLSLVPAIQHIRRASLQKPDLALQEFLFGGPAQLREKQDMAGLLNAARPDGPRMEAEFLPPYFGALRELVTRLGRRPDVMGLCLRYAEVTSALMADRTKITLRKAFDEQFDPVAAKLLSDVCGFLVAAGDLSPGFRAESRAYLLEEPINKRSNGMSNGERASSVRELSGHAEGPAKSSSVEESKDDAQISIESLGNDVGPLDQSEQSDSDQR